MWRSGLVLLFLGAVGADERPIVITELGVVRGKWMITQRGLRIAAFLGLPYAEPPVGELRFKSPKPWTEPWQGIRDATEDGSRCVQFGGESPGDEDCLYLNVFAPQVSENRSHAGKLSVLVFLHGGNFNVGSGDSSHYGPEYLLDQNVILITPNYRLGVLGFFSTGNEAAPGNYGLKDVIAALRWVQEHVHAFGGDPGSVTLGGQSAGAATAHLLALSKRTEGLFHRYVTQSGAGQAPWAYRVRETSRNASLELAARLDCTANDDREEDDEETVECLRGIDAEEIADAAMFNIVWDDSPWCVYGPTDEPDSDDAVLTEHPTKLMREGKIRDVPWMTGFTADEGLFRTVPLILNDTLRERLESDLETILPCFINYQDSVINKTLFVEALSSFYTDDNNNTFDLTTLVGDAMIVWPVYEALRYQANAMSSNVYAYRFAYEGTCSDTFLFGTAEHHGVSHSDDTIYLFPFNDRLCADLQLRNTRDNVTMINVMTEMWANFVKTGIPTARLTKKWKTYQDTDGFMRLGVGRSSDISMEVDFLTERMKFWKDLTNTVSIPTPVDTVDIPDCDVGGCSCTRVIFSNWFASMLFASALYVVM